jgi:hypothetical protein
MPVRRIFIGSIERLFQQFIHSVEMTALDLRVHALDQLWLVDFNVHDQTLLPKLS